MIKHIFLSLFFTLRLHCAEQSKIHEWNAAEYAQGNTVQYQSALYFLEHNNIELTDKRILDVGCGTGEISAYMAQVAESVFGFDASNNMTEWAQKNHACENISFEQCRVEDFSSIEKHDLATMFFCFHWFDDKQKALNNISTSLKANGELFGTFSTSDIPQHPGHAIVRAMMEKWNVQENMHQALARSTVNTQELETILTNAGFEIIICNLQCNEIVFSGRIDVENFTRPVMMSRPFIQKMALEEREQFFQEYIDSLMTILQDHETGQIIFKIYQTVVYARKKT
jgi:trans-aconitate methyltransferase